MEFTRRKLFQSIGAAAATAGVLPKPKTIPVLGLDAAPMSTEHDGGLRFCVHGGKIMIYHRGAWRTVEAA